jgi:general secretion pathway protein G
MRRLPFFLLLIALGIIAILSVSTIMVLRTHLQRAKEVELQQNVWAMRHAIEHYTTDKDKPPSSLQDLVSGGYLREVPKDPICLECDWREIPAQNSDDRNSAGGIGNVKSTTQGSDSSGKPYSEY